MCFNYKCHITTTVRVVKKHGKCCETALTILVHNKNTVYCDKSSVRYYDVVV